MYSTLLRGFLGGVLGVALVLLLLHAYQDHKMLHQIVTFINAAQQAQQAQPKPPTP